MASRYQKLLARGGSLQSIVNIDLPNYGIVNLKNSYISVMLNVNTTEASGNPTSVHVIYPKSDESVPYSNSVFIEDITFISEKYGPIESVKDCVVLTSNLQALTRNFDDIESTNYKNLCNIIKFEDYLLMEDASMLRQLSYNSSQKSLEIPFEIMIPLKDVLKGMGNVELIDLSKLGKCTIQFRWYYDFNDLGNNLITFEEFLPFIDPVNLPLLQVTTAGQNYVITNFTDNSGIPVLNFNNQTIVESLIFIGQGLNITDGTDNLYTVVTGLDLCDASGTVVTTNVDSRLKITLQDPIPANLLNVDIYALSIPAETITPVFSNPQLVIEQLFPNKRINELLNKNKELTIYPFTYQTDYVPESTTYSRVFEIQGDATNIICFKADLNDNPIAREGNLYSYRISVNGVDLTNRDVVYAGNGAPEFSLYHDQIIKLFDKMNNLNLKSITSKYGADDKQVIAIPLVSDGVPKKVQITLKAVSGHTLSASQLYLFIETIKTLQL